MAKIMIEFHHITRLEAVPYHTRSDIPCLDCDVSSGEYHHPGCSFERCPRCGCYLASCGCVSKRINCTSRIKGNEPRV